MKGGLHLQVQKEVELLEQAGSSSVVVVGSGPAGVELATTVADRLGKRANIQLISTGQIQNFQQIVSHSNNCVFTISPFPSPAIPCSPALHMMWVSNLPRCRLKAISCRSRNLEGSPRNTQGSCREGSEAEGSLSHQESEGTDACYIFLCTALFSLGSWQGCFF